MRVREREGECVDERERGRVSGLERKRESVRRGGECPGERERESVR